MFTTESISNNEKIFLVVFFGNLKMTFIIKMSFFDLIEKEEVFLNEYLLTFSKE